MGNVTPIFGVSPQASVTSTTEPPVAGGPAVPQQSEPDAVRARIQQLTTTLRAAASRIINDLPANKLSSEEISQFMNQFGALQAALVELFEKITDSSGDPNNAAIDQEITASAAPEVQSFIEAVKAAGPFTDAPLSRKGAGITTVTPKTRKILWFGGLLALGGLAIWWMTRGSQK